MPSSPQIYGTLALPGKETGLATLGELSAMRELQAARQAQAQKAQADAAKVQRDQEQQAQIQAIFQQNNSPEFGLNKRAVVQELYNIDPVKAKEFDTFYQKELDDEDKRQQAQRERDVKDMQFDFALLQGADTPEKLAFIKPRLKDKDLAVWVGDTPDPQKLAFLNTAMMTAGQYAEAMKAAKAEAKDDLELVVRHYAAAQDQEHIDDAIAEAKARGVGQEFVALGLSPQFDPAEVQRAGAFISGPSRASAAGLQSKELMVGGKPTVVNFDPSTGAYTPQTGVAPIPPASAASGAGGGQVSAGDKKLVDSILKNPAIYNGLTPTVKTRIASALSDAGFEFKTISDGKPATGVERKTLGFFQRAMKAAEELENIGPISGGENLWNETAGALPGVGNALKTAKGQQYTDAQRAFTEARLRKDSGAAIPTSEFESDRLTYFRQVGDSPEVIAQKDRLRNALLAALAYESGRALGEFYGDDAETMIADFKARAKGAAAPGAKTAAAVPETVKSALSSKGAGEYDLSDGHTYRKDASGAITVVK